MVRYDEVAATACRALYLVQVAGAARAVVDVDLPAQGAWRERAVDGVRCRARKVDRIAHLVLERGTGRRDGSRRWLSRDYVESIACRQSRERVIAEQSDLVIAGSQR